ncbi:hypothetical protein [Grimontia sp. SpTr1]|uniref:hypothetical protein n=1 Tax=Grimontia sp. SpTr1 TaxID=2995319 RepID=UPI00248C3B85|nr:hypothetical protein [Grimontia sp. SpTr1]
MKYLVIGLSLITLFGCEFQYEFQNTSRHTVTIIDPKSIDVICAMAAIDNDLGFHDIKNVGNEITMKYENIDVAVTVEESKFTIVSSSDPIIQFKIDDTLSEKISDLVKNSSEIIHVALKEHCVI